LLFRALAAVGIADDVVLIFAHLSILRQW